jgi:hypothetical protein
VSTPTTSVDARTALVAAKPPVAAPAATGVALLLAIALISLGVVAGRDALLATGAITGSPWIAAALHYLDGLTVHTWMIPAGLGAAVVGLLLLFAAIKPRRRTHRPLAATATWIRSRDILRLARCAAEPVTGVAEAVATGSDRRITLTITTVGGFDTAALKDTVHAAVTEALTPLAKCPRVRIRTKEQDLS